MIPQIDKSLSQTILETAGITHKSLLERYDEMAQEALRQRTLYWDIDDLVRETRYCKATLEKFVLCDPRIKEHQRQIGPRFKRLWLAEPTAAALEDILKY